MEKIEKELKFKIDDPQSLIKYFLEKGAILLNKSKEKTIRFDTPQLELEKKGIFLRVREGSKKTITLKEKIENYQTIKTRKETEFIIEDIEGMKYILEKIGLKYIRIFEKFRINLKYKDTVLSIDELPFGIYLEIEGEEKNIDIIIKELNYKDENKIIGTYWDLFEKYKLENNLKGIDILFSIDYKSKLLPLVN
jgi:adenylate cyclase class 2